MEQHSDSTVNMVSSSTQNPSKIGVAVAPATQDVTSEHCIDSASNKTVTLHQLPIPPASEPMQYRAIGLIQGTYVPSEEQFTRGMLTTEDNQTIDAVLLGRVMSLVKKHVDLTIPHLWVVYPRTRPKDEHLHAQIVGIWEPDNLNRDSSEDELLTEGGSVETDDSVDTAAEAAIASDGDDTASRGESDPVAAAESSEAEPSSEAGSSDSDEATASNTQLMKPSRPKAPKAEPVTPSSAQESSMASGGDAIPDMTDGYFSIRGEVIQFSPDDEQITVRIKQAKRKTKNDKDKKGGDESKEFKLQLKGRLDGRVVGYFWDLHAQRDGNDLIVTDSNMIKMVPPQKNRRKKFGGRGGGRGGPRRRDGGGGRPMRSGDRDRPSPSTSPRRGPASKPVLKKSVAKDSDTPVSDA